MSRGTPGIVTLGATPAVLLEAGDNELITLSKVSIYNDDTVPRLVTVYHDVTGAAGAVTATKMLVKTVNGKESAPLMLSSLYLANGSKLWVECDVAAKVNIDINYTSTDQQPL